jgi:alpha-ribazole phosphatase
MITYKLYMIRHGLTEGNLDGRYIGSTDLPLCKEGRAQLIQLAKTMEYPNVGRVYSPPLLRCTETASILYPDMKPVEVPKLREYSFGAFENKTVADIAATEAFRAWSDSGMRDAPLGGEDKAAFQNRCDEGFAEVLDDMMRNRITEAVLICHSGILMNLLAKYGYPKREPLRWKAEPGHGYTALITASMWQRAQVFEVVDPLPYDKQDEHEPAAYDIYDVPDGE